MLGRELTAWAVATLGILIGPHPTPLAFGQEAASGRNRTTQAVTSDRTTISLDGEWQIEDGKSATDIPTQFTHTAPVPGMANLADPKFKDVDRFYSREHLANRIRTQLSPEDWLTKFWKGKVDQDRNYFWYQKTFFAPASRAVALLKINKAQFGTAVWLNGEKLGEYAGCFTASYFHLEKAIRWSAENTLHIRIGAHPAVLPDDYPTGSDFEKLKWTPGIYDSVSLIFCDNPLVRSVQVAPRIASSEIIVQTTVENRCQLSAQAPREDVERQANHRRTRVGEDDTEVGGDTDLQPDVEDTGRAFVVAGGSVSLHRGIMYRRRFPDDPLWHAKIPL
jgi:hypothetical protein